MEILRDLEDDELFTPSVGAWALKKYRPHAYYANLFATAMKPPRWDQLCYIGLCSGSGRARIRDTGEIVETAAMTVLRLPEPFTKYVFCDQDGRAIEALRRRAEAVERERGLALAYVTGDVNEKVREIEREIPRYGRGNTLLSFAFLDPFATNIRFDTIQRIGSRRLVDWLILLPLGVDARRNLRDYLKPGNIRLDEFLGDPNWREHWEVAQHRGENIIAFLAGHFAGRMERIGYLPTRLQDMIAVRSDRRNLALYLLAVCSKNELGKQFWDEARRRTAEQPGLGL